MKIQKEETTMVAVRMPVSLVKVIDEAAGESSRTRTGEILSTLKQKYNRRPKATR